ncbi:hypothetical protein CHS0354_004675 [Potamilus streckersoni]|uniref:snRNA-activating protein complex subunit 1 n=1 Tax=Potamilus streckersoni TaxID=2493646 RepID=A0AAE0SAN4_9BIVA|nr:hypothetical protein CHS0354_004675 [Potamilus streckersoni]
MPPKNSKSYIPSKLVVYQPAAGVKGDFETLLERFTETGTVRYEKFAEIWRSMKINQYCAGRQNDREVREFIEECFHIASQFWLPPSSFQVRAGALYLLYGLFNFQLCMPRVKIRVTHKMWSDVIEFQAQAREEQHYDLDFIFHKLRLQKAFYFVSEHRELYLATTNFHQSQDLSVPDSFRDETTILEEVFSQDFMEQLSVIHDQYYKMKVALAGPNATTPDRSLDVMENKLIDNISKTTIAFKERRQGRAGRKRKQTEGGSSEEDEEGDSEEDSDPTYTPGNINTKRNTIKASAYSGLARASRSRRHRQAVMEDDSSPSKMQKKRGTPKENDADELCQQSEDIKYSSPEKNAKHKPDSEEEEEVEKEKDHTVSLDMPCLSPTDNPKPGSSAEEKSSKLVSKGKKSKRTTGKVLPKMLPNLEYNKKEKKEKKMPGQKKRITKRKS